MAIVRLTSGQSVELPHDKGIAIWEVITGKVEPTPEQDRFCEKVQSIYLDWRTAPDDYVLDRAVVLKKMYAGTNTIVAVNKRIAEARTNK